eukprot:378202-Pleurochrysis_carterae.AAC.1
MRRIDRTAPFALWTPLSDLTPLVHRYDVLRVNYANPDMVGHTGDLAATTTACEFCDSCLKDLLDAVNELNGIFIVTADHGNADDM